MLREGTHIINPALFVVMTEDATCALSMDAQEAAYYERMRQVLDERQAFSPVVIQSARGEHDSDQLAIVTVQDGPALVRDDLLAQGCKGVWEQALMPGKYAFNTYAGKIELVPTANFVLMWQSGASGSSFDSKLRDRQIAREQVETFAQQQIAADKQRELNEAEKRRQEIEALAQAERFRQESEGAAIAARSQALEGEGADRQLMQTVMLRLAEAFETAKVPLVPQIQLGGGGGAGDQSALATLMGVMSALRGRELLTGPSARTGDQRA